MTDGDDQISSGAARLHENEKQRCKARQKQC
jgi:hypothetical protein